MLQYVTIWVERQGRGVGPAPPFMQTSTHVDVEPRDDYVVLAVHDEHLRGTRGDVVGHVRAHEIKWRKGEVVSISYGPPGVVNAAGCGAIAYATLR